MVPLTVVPTGIIFCAWILPESLRTRATGPDGSTRAGAFFTVKSRRSKERAPAATPNKISAVDASNHRPRMLR